MKGQSWIIFGLSGLYVSTGWFALYGLYLNQLKKKQHMDDGTFEKRKKPLQWRQSFFCCVILAALVRAATLLLSAIKHTPIRLKSPESKSQFLENYLAVVPSLLFFSAFSLIVWFFGQIVCQPMQIGPERITWIALGINAALYLIEGLLFCIPLISDGHWGLAFDVGNPILAFAYLFLAVCFTLLPLRLSILMQRETDKIESQPQQPEPSILNSRNWSGLLSQRHYPDEEQDDYGAVQTRQIESPQKTAAKQIKHEQTRRLLYLSTVCVLCFMFRAVYPLILQLNPNVDLKDAAVGSLRKEDWEAIYFAFSEFPAFTAGLLFMLYSRNSGKSNHQSGSHIKKGSAAGRKASSMVSGVSRDVYSSIGGSKPSYGGAKGSRSGTYRDAEEVYDYPSQSGRSFRGSNF